MNRINRKQGILIPLVIMLLMLFAAQAQAIIDGITGTTFDFTAKEGHISTPDGNSILMWGYANGNNAVQYPGPTLIVDQNDVITIHLTNELPSGNSVSMLFPGHDVTASGGSQGFLARESNSPADVVTYTFTASQPGTYIYHSGTRPELQIEMGLVGAIIVRPEGYSDVNKTAYGSGSTAYDYEYLFLLTDMDPIIHEQVEFGLKNAVDNATRAPVIWMINGRAAPDTLAPAYTPLLPHQPYNCLPRMNPGGKLLMRIVSAGRDLHPFHHHGNNSTVIAKDGRLLSTNGIDPDLATSEFTIQAISEETVDAIFEWTGSQLGWDMYGTGAGFEHDCVDGNGDYFDDVTHEYCPDHGKPLPVVLPEKQDLGFGGWWGGSPYMGSAASLPPGEGGLNINGGYFFMWHSHTEKELTNFDIFPGGMMTMMVVEPPHIIIP
jgi:FtsP/CotA-like multicopper oxidase with cupredoxin domain